MKSLVYSLVTVFSLALMLSLFSTGSSAQTTHRRHKAKPLATPPTRELTGAEIISEGGVPDEQVEITPVEQPTPKPAANNSARIRNLDDRVHKLESGQNTYEQQQKRLLTNLDIITRAETRAESLRKQSYEMMEKEETIKTRLDQIEYDIRPENIERILQMNGGSMRPEEIRDARRKSLETEREHLQSLLTTVQSNRATLEANVTRADQMVEKLRAKLEKDIDDALVDPPAEQQ